MLQVAYVATFVDNSGLSSFHVTSCLCCNICGKFWAELFSC